MAWHPLCAMFRHRRDRRKAWHDGLNYRSNCKRCGIPLIRTVHGWRAFDSQRDLSTHRRPHPHSYEGN